MSLKAAIAANQRALMDLTDPELARLLPVLKQLREDEAKILSKFFAREDAEASYTMAKHASLLHQLDKAIEVAEQKIPWAMQIDLRTGVVSTGPTALGNLLEMITESEIKFRGFASGLRLDVARIVADSKRMLVSKHRKSAVRYAGRVGESIRTDFVAGVVRGESIGQLAKRLMRGGQSDDPAIAIARKQFFRNEHDATRLARTEMNHAYNLLQQEGLEDADEEDPGWMKMWDATNDKRTCVACYAMDGEKQPVRKLYSCGVMFPPLHPNDRCGSTPVRADWSEKSEVKGLRRAASRVTPIVPVEVEYEPESARARGRVRRLAKKIRDDE